MGQLHTSSWHYHSVTYETLTFHMFRYGIFITLFMAFV